MARKSKNTQLAARLAALHAADLFVDLALEEAKQASTSGDQEDALAVAVDQHVSDHAYPYVYRAIQHIPAELGLAAVLREIGLRTIAFDSDDGTVAFTPRTHHQWASMLGQALEKVGDARRFVALEVIDWEEPLFVLATPAQAKVLRDVELEDPYVEDAEPATVAPSAALAEIVDLLARKLPAQITPRVVDTTIELAATPGDIARLVEALYTARYAQMRLRAHTERRYGGKRRDA